MEVELPEIAVLAEEMRQLRQEIAELREKVQPAKRWYRREDLAVLKSLPTSAFYAKPWLLPSGEKIIGGVSMWPASVVEKWLSMSDDELKPAGNRGVRGGRE